MDLVRTWTGQLARAAGASLLAPLVLLVAAGVVASAGGVGSFGSLREIASGPTLPDIGLAEAPGSALADAEIVGADLAAPPAEAQPPPLPADDALASAAPPGAPEQAGEGVTEAPPQRAPQRRSGESFELEGSPTTPGGGETSPQAPPAAPVVPVPAPVEDLLDATRGLGDTLREPLRPITDTLLQLLRGPPPRQ